MQSQKLLITDYVCLMTDQIVIVIIIVYYNKINA